MDRSGNFEQRVLVLPLTAKDAELTRSILNRAGIECLCCTSLEQICDELEAGAGAVLMAEEAVIQSRENCLIDYLALQPAWSDLPVLVLARPGADSAAVFQAMELLGNVTVLERPVRVAALVSAVRTALRARSRQYQTRNHLAELTLAFEARSRLAAIVESSDDAIISKSLDGTIQTWNAGAERLFGYTAAEVIGQPITILIPPARQNEEPALLARLRRGERIDHFETVRVTKDGRQIYISLSVSPVRNAEGQILGAAKVARDITQHKIAEQQLRQSESEARRLLELHRTTMANLGEGMYTVDRQGLVTYLNPEAERLFGWTAAELVGKRMHDVTHYKRPDGSPFPIEECSGFRVLHDGNVLRDFEDVFIRKDGTFFPVAYSSSPLWDAEGQIIGLVVVFQDITERKRHEQALRDADRRKDEFLATLAHELRNPLAPIRNSLQILRMTACNDPGIERIHEIMERQVNHMVRLVDDLMEVSRITRDLIELRKEETDLATIIRTAVETSRPLIEASEHQLAISIPQEPIRLYGDTVRLSQVFANLLNNAAKYTDRGGQIWLNVRKEGSNAVVSVRDSGIGISATTLPVVFDMFMQADRSTKRSQGGLGIGLTLVKRLVEMHGGTVSAHSPGEGQGSEFVVSLPIAVIPPQDVGPPPEIQKPAVPTRRRVLVVDDNEDAAASMGMLLRVLGADVQIAHDGAAALATIESYRPDVVLLDIGMPGMDGFEVARRVRKRADFDGIVLIALTGWGQTEDRNRTQSAGFDHHLVKPADITELQSLLISASR